jgi:hypothetical protein
MTPVHRGAPDKGCGSSTLVDETTTAATVCFANRHILDPTTKPLPVTVTEVPPADGPLGGCREARTGSPLPSRVSARTREHSKRCPAILVDWLTREDGYAYSGKKNKQFTTLITAPYQPNNVCLLNEHTKKFEPI